MPVRTTKELIEITMQMEAGYEASDIQVKVKGGKLQVKGNTSSSYKKKGRKGSTIQSFERSFPIPSNTDIKSFTAVLTADKTNLIIKAPRTTSAKMDKNAEIDVTVTQEGGAADGGAGGVPATPPEGGSPATSPESPAA